MFRIDSYRLSNLQELNHIYATLALFVLCDKRLLSTKAGGNFGLCEASLLASLHEKLTKAGIACTVDRPRHDCLPW